MQLLFQSAFLQALGFAIANSLWQTALVWLLYISVTHLLPLPSTVRYRLAVIAQLLSFCWFAITIQFYYGEYAQALAHSSASGIQTVQGVIAGNNGFSSQLIRYIVRAEQVLPYLSMAYLLLMLVLCIRWITGYRQTQQMRRNGISKIDVDWRLFVKRTAAQLGIKKEVSVFLSEKIGTPLTIGFWKPVILVPLASINHLTIEQLEAVLLHELAHIKRYDYLVNIILSVVEIALFFNPFTQLLSKNIRKERENCCDDWVLQFQYQASDYAEALLRIASLQVVPALSMTAAGNKNELLVRVKRMIGQKENRFSYRRQLLAFLLVTGMLSSIAWLNPVAGVHSRTHTSQQPVVENKRVRSLAVEPMAMKVNNPLFNPVFFLSAPLKAELKRNIATAEDAVTEENVHPETIASVLPVVADAMDQAAREIAKLQEKDWSKELAGMEQAQRSLEQFIRDSARIPAMLRPKMKQDAGASMESIKNDIDKARIEITKMNQAKKSITFDQRKVRQELETAMGELSKLGLDKLIDQSLKASGMTLELGVEKIRLEKKSEDKRKHQSHRTEPPVPDDMKEVTNDDAGEEPSPFINVSFEKPVINAELLAELRSLASLFDESSVHSLTPETVQRIKIKLALLQQLFSKKIKITPAVLRWKSTGDSIYVSSN